MSEEIIEAEVEEVQNLPAVRASEAIMAREEISVTDLVAQRDKIVEAMRVAMVEGVHYGHIPGINKPSLFKPGAEMLNVLFRFAPSYKSQSTFHDGGHLTVISSCTLTHIPTRMVIAEGEGLCSTYETKYAYRTGGRICPECGQAAIIKGKAEFGGGWLCYSKKGGCNTKWADGTEQADAFESTDTGRADNPDLPDAWNTVLKMAAKRALVAAILNGTAASDVFTQDAEDMSKPPAAAAAAEPPKAFDPETDLMAGAISGNDAPERLAAALNGFDPTVDWQETIASVVQKVYGKKSRRDLKGDELGDFWRRLSNTVKWIDDHAKAGDFPPIDESILLAGLNYAFGKGSIAKATYLSAEPAVLTPDEAAQADAAKDDVPFGE